MRVRDRSRKLVLMLAGALCVSLVHVGARGQADGPRFDDIVEHFKYGSVGTEVGVGVPYWVWRVLPIVFADKLPDRPGEGYERLGFIFEETSHGRPIGTTYSADRVPLVGLNCATCHTGTVRFTPSSTRQVIPGMPAHGFDLQAYARFLSACANDERFTASTLIDAITRVNPDFGWVDSLVHRFLVIPRLRRGILEREERNSWFDVRPPQGPGRVDTFNPYKVLLELGIENDRTVGTADLPSLWNQRMRQGLWLHWDGNNDSVEERNKSAAIGAGATPESLDLASMARIEEWILDLKPPAYPADRIDSSLLEAGRSVYDRECASCHDIGGALVGQVTDVAEVGTDRERVDSFTAGLAAAMNTIGEGYPWRFTRFRTTNGYANMPLDGLWLRAPYLHNGSVPNLRALLSPELRPVEFFRAYDVYDWENVGFVSSGPEAEREGVRFDTRERGNGNAGHTYGAMLEETEKTALIEYLKTK